MRNFFKVALIVATVLILVVGTVAAVSVFLSIWNGGIALLEILTMEH